VTKTDCGTDRIIIPAACFDRGDYWEVVEEWELYSCIRGICYGPQPDTTYTRTIDNCNSNEICLKGINSCLPEYSDTPRLIEVIKPDDSLVQTQAKYTSAGIVDDIEVVYLAYNNRVYLFDDSTCITWNRTINDAKYTDKEGRLVDIKTTNKKPEELLFGQSVAINNEEYLVRKLMPYTTLLCKGKIANDIQQNNFSSEYMGYKFKLD
jgi:hypothetical protein